MTIKVNGRTIFGGPKFRRKNSTTQSTTVHSAKDINRVLSEQGVSNAVINDVINCLGAEERELSRVERFLEHVKRNNGLLTFTIE